MAGRRRGKDVGKQNTRLQPDSAKPGDAAAEASNPSSPHAFTYSSFPLLPASRPALFKREVQGLASKTDVRFTEISSHQEGQEGLIQSPSVISFPLFVPRLFCLSLPISSLPPTALYFNLLSVRLTILCSCPFLSLFEPAHFYSSCGIMAS